MNQNIGLPVTYFDGTRRDNEFYIYLDFGIIINIDNYTETAYVYWQEKMTYEWIWFGWLHFLDKWIK